MIAGRDDNIYECKLNNANIKIQVKYWMPMTENASFKLWLNDNLIIDLKYFNTSDFCGIGRCPTVEKIKYKYYKDYNDERIIMNGTDTHLRLDDIKYYVTNKL